MKLLISTHSFYPSIGGLETVVEILAREFVLMGHEVSLVTQTLSTGPAVFPFEIVRCPNPLKLIKLVHWCDVYFQNNVSLRVVWPLLLIHRPWVVAHHGWYSRPDGRIGWQDRLKRFLARFAIGVAVSTAVARDIATPAIVIHNPYRDDLFRKLVGVKRTRALVFLGRLVSDKGVDLLLKALAVLKEHGLRPGLTIIGSGPEESRLRQLTDEEGIADQVVFAGPRQGEDLVRVLNEHEIMVVPSRWNEPFGVVVLEGIACGCVVVGSRGGGLQEAVGPCGETFPNGDVHALAEVLRRLLLDAARCTRYRSQAAAHLAGHRRRVVAASYMRVLEDAVRR